MQIKTMNNNRTMDNNKTWVTLLQRWLYLLRAKFRNDSNYLLHETGQGRCMEEHSLEMTEVLQASGTRWWRQAFGLQIFWKMDCKVYLVYLRHLQQLSSTLLYSEPQHNEMYRIQLHLSVTSVPSVLVTLVLVWRPSDQDRSNQGPKCPRTEMAFYH